jgi:Domain of unknown function (DUF6048)
MLKYFFSLGLTVVLIRPVFSQEKKEKPNPADTIKNKYLPTGLRLGTDLISIIKSGVVPSFKGWEMNADLDFYKYYFAVDYGNWARNYDLVNGNYQNNGNYFRIGGDINLLLKDPERNMFFFGFRYGHSSFSESLNYSYADSVYGSSANQYMVNKTGSNKGLSAHWLELTTGLRVKIWSGFWMGYTARLKFAPGISGHEEFNTFDIPGYGLAAHSNYWGLNYQLFWRFPVRKIK